MSDKKDKKEKKDKEKTEKGDKGDKPVKVKPGEYGGGFYDAEKNTNVFFLEFTVVSGKDFPGMNMDGKTIDPYAIMWLASRPGEQHKTKIQKKQNDPSYDETFGFVLDPSKVATDSVVVQFYNFKTIGSPDPMGKEFQVPLSGLTQDVESEKTLPIPGVKTNATATFQLRYSEMKSSEITVPLFSHTGNSAKAYFNSITRTIGKARIRRGERGTDTTVAYLEVTVHEGKDLPSMTDGTSPPSPYFFIHLNSSEKIKYKSTICKETANPKWDQTFGFELATAYGNKIQDQVRLCMRGYNPYGRAHIMGDIFVPLSSLTEVGSEKTDWYKIDKAKSGQLRVTVKRVTKKVEDLEIQATSATVRLNNKVLYVLGLCQRALADLGLAVTIEINIKLAIIGMKLAVKISGVESEEELKKIDKSIEEAEKILDAEEPAPELVAEELDQDTEDKSLMKSIVMSGVKKLKTGILTTVARMKALGISGEVGLVVMIEAFDIGIEIALTAEIAG